MTPSHGRAEWAARALEHHARGEVPDAPELERVVGRLEADHQRRLVDQRRSFEDGGQGVLGRPELLAREEEHREVVGERGGSRPVRKLDHHGDAALHVACAEADDGAVLEAAGQVVLGRDGVEVAGENDEGPAAANRVDQGLTVVEDRREADSAADVLGHSGLRARDGGDVDEGERPVGDPGG